MKLPKTRSSRSLGSGKERVVVVQDRERALKGTAKPLKNRSKVYSSETRESRKWCCRGGDRLTCNSSRNSGCCSGCFAASLLIKWKGTMHVVK